MIKKKKAGYYRNIGLLILRVGLGFMFILHGYPKVFGGPEKWTAVGSAVQLMGVHFSPMFFGFITAISEFFGGIFLFWGLFFRPSLSLMIIVMIVASVKHISVGENFSTSSHSIEMAIVFISLLFMGPGIYSLDNGINKRRKRRY